jgi:superfamily II DNA or RNA helicase
MTSLSERLCHLFPAGEFERSDRTATDVRITCPRVGIVRASVTLDGGEACEVEVELSAGRRGGMTLESRSSSRLGRQGTPCAALAAVLKEVDRRELFASLADHTPLVLECVADESLPDPEDAAPEDAALEDTAPERSASPACAIGNPWPGIEHEQGELPESSRGDSMHPAGSREARLGARSRALRPAFDPVSGADTLDRSAGHAPRPHQRQPPWAVELDDRRRLVEPVVRSRSVHLPDPRRDLGALVFVLELAGGSDARSVQLSAARLQLDVTGGTTGRLRPATIPADRLEELEQDEREVVARLLGSRPLASGRSVGGMSFEADAGSSGSADESSSERGVSRIVLGPHAAAEHLAMLCERGRLVLQPEPKRAPEHVVQLAWDGGRPWEFVLVVEPDDPDDSDAGDSIDAGASRRRNGSRPAKASLRGMLARGSERRGLDAPRAVLRAGLVVFQDRIARLDSGEDGRGSVMGWLSQFERRGGIDLSGSQVDGLVERLATLAAPPRLVLPAWTGWRIESGRPTAKLLLDDTPAVEEEPKRRGRTAGRRVALAGRIWFEYAGVMVAADDPAGAVIEPSRRVFVRRSRAAEREALAVLARHGVTAPRASDAAAADTDHHVEIQRQRLDAAVPLLASEGWTVEVAGRRYRPAGSVAWNVTSGIDWFELSGSVDFGGVSAKVPALLAALQRGERLVELSDGSMGVLPEDWAGRYGSLVELAEHRDGRLFFGRIQMALLDALLAGQPSTRFDEAFEALREELARGERPEPVEEPEGFVGTLRHYQREGLGWLVFLERMGLGGCLADDMGLGKTIQVLAFLVRRGQVVAEAGLPHRPSLVVVPKSLVFNWMDEARRFAPQLKVLNHTGNTRTAEADRLAEYDLVLTTYGTLRRDVLRHREAEFDYVVLDEAQSIKNAGSQAAKACRLLRSRHRLAVTGTPVENHIGELWSIFEFLNPGQLGSAARLKRFLAGGRGGGGTELVARAVRPYLLRRTKGQVLDDLPEKTEQTIQCELGEEQRKAYDELREHYRRELAGRIGSIGIGRSRIAVLEALLRLRQTACHPGLVDPARIDAASAKLDTLEAQLAEVLDEGHKALVFSQFTSFLALLRRRLDAAGRIYEYLDGKTTDRQARVERFQEDPDCRLFLVSLKAGGQGLNLTAADYIYILDPWWNPAVEAQAIDRAHRIGQTRRVFAYRLIARDTVEEKIVALQDRKRELAESIVRADESLLSSLTAEDVDLLFS